jgi:hypothetical protein
MTKEESDSIEGEEPPQDIKEDIKDKIKEKKEELAKIIQTR